MGSSVSVNMFKYVLLLVIVLGSASAEVFTSQASFVVKVGKTKKTATCTFTISYTGDTVSQSDSKVKCSIAWPKSSALSKSLKKTFTLGDVTDTVFTAEVSFKLDKKKKKPAGTTKTILNSITTAPVTADAPFYPASLWCPEEDTIIFGAGKYNSVVNEALADSYDQCAQRCAEYTNDAGNAPCFSWTYNDNTNSVLGLDAKICRLLAYMEVQAMSASGVQSGYHKCWNAMLTSTAP